MPAQLSPILSTIVGNGEVLRRRRWFDNFAALSPEEGAPSSSLELPNLGLQYWESNCLEWQRCRVLNYRLRHHPHQCVRALLRLSESRYRAIYVHTRVWPLQRKSVPKSIHHCVKRCRKAGFDQPVFLRTHTRSVCSSYSIVWGKRSSYCVTTTIRVFIYHILS
jgi:hypothetical protein